MYNNLIPNIVLNNGVTIPQIGLGVFEIKDGFDVERSVTFALHHGYRLIDTAAAYINETGVGNAIRHCGVPRNEIFVTTKLWNANHAYEDTLRAFDDSASKLSVDYVDLFLIHFPLPMFGLFNQAWRALERLYDEKRIRAIGVANFLPPHLKILLHEAHVVPALNQIELHPMFQQRATQDYCRGLGIAVESYSPLMRAGTVLSHPTVTGIAQHHARSAAQIILRWHIQSGFIVIPKSISPERIIENISIFDFVLSAEEMELIDGLEQGFRIGVDPDTFDYR